MSTALTSTTKLSQVATVKEMMANTHAAGQLASVAARHLSPEQMMRTVALSISKTPKLAECTPLSLLGALMQSASLGLIPNTVMGHSYLVPFENRRAGIVEAQLVIGYRGYIQLAHNSGQIASLDAAIHYADDPVWKWRRGSSAVLEHEQGDMAGEMLHAYAIFETKAGGKTWVVWPESKLVAHRDRYSKGYGFDIKRGKKPTDANVNIWLSHPDVARMKTMIRQLSKVMPMATEIPAAAAFDGARADYATFALDPSVGAAQIEHLDDQVNEDETPHDEDGVVEETKVETKAEAKPEPKQETATPGPDGKAALAEASSKLKAKAAEVKKDEPKPEPEKKAAAEPEPKWVAMFRSDLLDWTAGDHAGFMEAYRVNLEEAPPALRFALMKEAGEGFAAKAEAPADYEGEEDEGFPGDSVQS